MILRKNKYLSFVVSRYKNQTFLRGNSLRYQEGLLGVRNDAFWCFDFGFERDLVSVNNQNKINFKKEGVINPIVLGAAPNQRAQRPHSKAGAILGNN